MTAYRRNFVPGGIFFFTVNLADRGERLLTMHTAARRVWYERHPFDLDAVLVLPDHLHVIWTSPNGDADFALRWRLIKTVFSRGLPAGESPRRMG